MNTTPKSSYDEWLGTTVYDATGDKIGDITDIYLDDVSGQPEWMTISTGWFGSKEQFVPIAGTSNHEGGFRIEYTTDQIKAAPSIDTDQDHLDPDEERRLYAHYGLDFDGADHEATYGGRARVDDGYDYSDTRAETGAAATGDTISPTRSDDVLDVDREAGRVRVRRYVVANDGDVAVPVTRKVARIVREPGTGHRATER